VVGRYVAMARRTEVVRRRGEVELGMGGRRDVDRNGWSLRSVQSQEPEGNVRRLDVVPVAGAEDMDPLPPEMLVGVEREESGHLATLEELPAAGVRRRGGGERLDREIVGVQVVACGAHENLPFLTVSFVRRSTMRQSVGDQTGLTLETNL
jgi:hypothetical protein